MSEPGHLNLRRSLSPFPHPAHPGLIPYRERRQLDRDVSVISQSASQLRHTVVRERGLKQMLHLFHAVVAFWIPFPLLYSRTNISLWSCLTPLEDVHVIDGTYVRKTPYLARYHDGVVRCLKLRDESLGERE